MQSLTPSFDLEVTQFKFRLVARDSLIMPHDYNKGNVLRGAFGTVFKEICCGSLCRTCATSPFREQCPYAAIFEPSPPTGSERLSANSDIPRPFVFRPPMDSKSRYERGETFEFQLLLFGKAHQYFPYFVVAFRELAERGFGVGRGRCLLVSITATAPDGLDLEVYSGETQSVRSIPPQLRARDLLCAPLGSTEQLTVQFITPTFLKCDGRAIESPDFHHVIKRLRDRVNALAWFYNDVVLEIDFAEFGRRAEQVSTMESHTSWIEQHRYSTRTHQRHPMGGFVGTVTYCGNLTEFIPLLRLAEWTHVGKYTVWGNGWIRVIRQEGETQDRSMLSQT